MFIPPSSDACGRPFDAAIIEAVWSKAAPSPEHSPLRLDAYGALIWKQGYGNTNTRFGWEIAHRQPVNQGGGDELDNLEPRQWENNRRNGDG